MSKAPRPPFRVGILTLFPELFPGTLGVSIFARAREAGLWALDIYDIRDHAPASLEGRMDAPPFGGGAGMILRADAVAPAIDAARRDMPDAPLIALTPSGRPLTQRRVREWSEGAGVIFLCGRYEGWDERLIESRRAEEASLGDFLLSGGEVAALALAEATLRLLPGVMGSEASGAGETFERHLLQHPHYTKPALWEGRAVPDVLLSGHHERIARWRHGKAEERTKRVRPDLYALYEKHSHAARTVLKERHRPPHRSRARKNG